MLYLLFNFFFANKLDYPLSVAVTYLKRREEDSITAAAESWVILIISGAGITIGISLFTFSGSTQFLTSVCQSSLSRYSTTPFVGRV